MPPVSLRREERFGTLNPEPSRATDPGPSPDEETGDVKDMQHAQLIPNRQLLIPKLVAGLVYGFEFDRGDCTGRHRLGYRGLMATLKQIPHL